MTRWLLWLYPAWFRDRYGDEIEALLADSDHRFRDLVNVAVAAVRLRWENYMSRPLRDLADAFVVVTVFGLGYAVNDLEHGMSEIGRHWWSSIALVVTVAALVARGAIEALDRRRERPPTR
jgi:hypothetical protein